MANPTVPFNPLTAFFNPQSQYGGTQAWQNTPYITQFYDPNNPQGVYASYLGNTGLGGFDEKSQFARSLYGQTQAGYQAALRQNPNLSYLNYLRETFGPSASNLTSIWNSFSPSQRGENPSLWNQGPSRVIAWG